MAERSNKMKDILFFAYFTVFPLILAFLIDWVYKYIKDCVKRVKSRNAARKRLAEIKRQEEYERETFRFSDPHYFGD